MTEWKQERPPLTDAHLAEIRERTKKGHILDWPNVDRAVLLAEVDRLRKQIETALSRGNHNNSCAFTSTRHCVCWKSDLNPSLKRDTW